LKVKDIDTYHLGYVIGPRINAAGRIGSPLEAVKLLVSNDEKQCKEIANDLNDVNFSRQQMTIQILESAKKNVIDTDNMIFLLGEGWHEGIIGLVAGKLEEEYCKPVLVVTNNDGVVKGSARSIKGFNITQTLEKFNSYLEKFGDMNCSWVYLPKGFL
jgi:single-stranded-DNA-specific exonuclease